jgi:hypothetical protein
MGDRAVVLVEQTTSKAETAYLHLYAHWDGAEWAPRGIAAALKAQPRWGDQSYATRIMLTELFGGVDQVTGYGVSLCSAETEHPVPVINLDDGTAYWISPDEYDNGDYRPAPGPLAPVALPLAERV